MSPTRLPGAANDADSRKPASGSTRSSAVIAAEGGERAHFLLEQLIDQARQAGIDVPFSANTAYVNTIPTDQEERSPGNIEIEERLRAYMRWNAMAMVVKANRLHPRRRRRPRRPHLELRVAGDDVRHRLQPLLARRRRPTTAATCSTSRATRRPASTRAPSWKAGSARSSC